MIIYRFHKPSDFVGLVSLYHDFFACHRQLLGNSAPLTNTEALEITRESLRQKQSWLIVAEEQETGQLVGFARWEEREGAFFGRELFVCPEHRGQGIGARLLEEVERKVQQAGSDALFISIIPQNRRMLAFSVRHGYDTLNTVELRKELGNEQSRRKTITLFGLKFKII